MKTPDEVKREFVRQWVRKAAEDIAAADHLLAGGARFSYSTAFHAQQAAEKLLKAVLVWHQVEFPKTHDIARLVALAKEVDSELAEAVRGAEALTPYGVAARYPGELPEPSLDDAQAATSLAKQVRKAVLEHLPGEFRSATNRE